MTPKKRVVIEEASDGSGFIIWKFIGRNNPSTTIRIGVDETLAKVEDYLRDDNIDMTKDEEKYY